MLREALNHLADVPQTSDIQTDWRHHQVDRSMPHYRFVMQWVRLFLFHCKLATFSGTHTNLSLLFPMEQVFEDFVTDSFRRYQPRYAVAAQRPQRPIATIDERPAFVMKPDVSLLRDRDVAFILDAKWKEIDTTRDYPKHQNARPQWLDDAHVALDATVAAAYGWSADITDDEALRELLMMN